jgi:hypothetical protein
MRAVRRSGPGPSDRRRPARRQSAGPRGRSLPGRGWSARAGRLGRPCRLQGHPSAISQPLRGLRFGTGLARDHPPRRPSPFGPLSRSGVSVLALPSRLYPPLSLLRRSLSPSGGLLAWSGPSAASRAVGSASPDGSSLRVKEIFKLKTRARALRFLEPAPLLGSRGGRAGKGTKSGAGKGTCQFTGECR